MPVISIGLDRVVSLPASGCCSSCARISGISTSYTWGFDIFQDDKLIYRNRDGQRENLDITTYLGFNVGSGANFNAPAPFIGALVHNESIHLMVP